MPANDFTIFSGHVNTLQKLKKQLPSTLPVAKADGRISEVFSSLPVPENPIEQWEIFDRRLNALWSEDKRVNGRLPHMEVGQFRAETIREALLTKVWIRSGHFRAVPRARKVEKHGSAALLNP
ncbi:hypothetical protein FA13DRAFT_1794200 [Coprinellus micaceus]|uniref:Uncharacterized protein n=1 Tax=Coprinellus micaceus TaxID=71717 RepID=A0A4Y7T3N1_COPMI|nr:hypothetical protein FA13DRAFT_1794200 [Coprinellus micaceus]